MKHISDSLIERLRNDISLVRLIEAKGVQLSKKGDDFAGRCPFHVDTELSLIVNPRLNQWSCEGTCNTTGSVLDWVMRAEGVSLHHAVELLQSDDPVLMKPITGIKQNTVPKLPAAFEKEADDAAVLNAVVEHYQRTLQNCTEAHQFLEQRGLKSHELVHAHQLGYSNRTLGYRLPLKNRAEGKVLRGRLEQLGIYRSTGHEHFVGCLMVPIRDLKGQIVQLYGRRIQGGKEGSHLYLTGPMRGVWNIAVLEHQEEVILCKSILDAMTFWCAGYRNVTACYGYDGFTAGHLAAFKDAPIRRVILAFDGTAQGDEASLHLAEQLGREGLHCAVSRFPKGLDVNAYALKVGQPEKLLGQLIRAAEDMGSASFSTFTRCSEVKRASVTVDQQSTEETVKLERAVSSERVPSVNNSQSTPATEIEDAAETNETNGDITVLFEERQYRVRGLEKNLGPEVLRVNVLVSRDDGFHIDTLDLYAARARATFTHQAAVELGVGDEVIKRDLGRLLLKLELLQQQLNRTVLPRDPEIVMTEAERKAALAFLSSPDLLDRVLADFECYGVVGEHRNVLAGYLACISRKLVRPLALLIQSNAAAGKSSLLDALLAMTPEEDRIQYSAITGQSLYYLSGIDLKHKILAIAEEEGASQAAYALKLLQSQGMLSIASTGKDQKTGRLVATEYRVEGPVMLAMTTTAVDLDDELLSRCVVLAVDEGREQTRAIHAQQRRLRTLEGLVSQETREGILQLHQNAQRLLRPLAVVNPYADRLTFLDDRTRSRRDHEKYLTLIDTIALLHQYQRPIKSVRNQAETIEYVEVAPADIELANRIAHELLGRSVDELPPQTRLLLCEIQALVTKEARDRSSTRSAVRFTRKTLRNKTRWGDTQLKVHLSRLVDMEYLLVHRGQDRRYEYELLYDGADDDKPHLNGLIGATTLRTDISCDPRTDISRSLVGEQSDSSRTYQTDVTRDQHRVSADKAFENSQMHGVGNQEATQPYTQETYSAG